MSLFNSYFGTITGSQFVIPGGIKGYCINIQSGSATINGVTIPSPVTFQGGAVDSKMSLQTSNSGICLGCTGGRVSYNYTA